jgi:predicted RNA polymerase sigma factor
LVRHRLPGGERITAAAYDAAIARTDSAAQRRFLSRRRDALAAG